MSKGKTHCRGAKCNILKANERNARHKARLRTLKKAYPKQAYDGHRTDNEEPPILA